MNTEIKNLSEVSEYVKNCSFEQLYHFKIGAQGYTYEAMVERDENGNITDDIEGEALNTPKIDSETWVAYRFIKEADAWYDVDQLLWDTDEGETFTYLWKPVESYDVYNDDDMEFISEHADENGYVSVYITLIENTIIEDE